MKPLFQLASMAGARARLSVLIFHRVAPRPDPLFPSEIDAAFFDQMLGWVKTWFHVLPLDEAIRRLHEGTLPARAAALSFDDGYADNYTQALPLLKRHGLPCSFFIATGFLDGGRMWNDTLIESVRLSPLAELDLRGLQGGRGEPLERYGLPSVDARRQAIQTLIGSCKYLAPEPRLALVTQIAERAQASLPDDLMMTSAQVRGLRAAGMQIGAHTVSHPILASLPERAAMDEISESKRVLEDLLGERVTLFAYPNGKPGVDYLPQVHPAQVRELGFEGAVSTHWAAGQRGSDVFQIPRFTPWDRSRTRFALRLLQNYRRPEYMPPPAHVR